MDKYEFNIKVEQIKKLVNKSDYETGYLHYGPFSSQWYPQSSWLSHNHFY